MSNTPGPAAPDGATAGSAPTRPKERRRSRRGQGSIWLAGRTWQIGYYRNGRRIRESSRSAVRADAERLLRQ